MAIQWNREEVGEFFGEAEESLCEGLWILRRTGPLLKYELWINEKHDHVGISGDDYLPFGSDSLYEIYVPCTSIKFASDGYYPNQKSLEFYYGDADETPTLRLQILKRPTGDLKVWPYHPLPENHPLMKEA